MFANHLSLAATKELVSGEQEVSDTQSGLCESFCTEEWHTSIAERM